MKYYWFAHGEVAGVRGTVSRTGYTGEDGYEIFVPPQFAPALWTALLEAGKPHGLVPCGLGARDTLRLEAAMRLYGNDFDETTSVLEADLGWLVGWNKPAFLGHEVLRRGGEQIVERRIGGTQAQPHDVLLGTGRPNGRHATGASEDALIRRAGVERPERDRSELAREVA